MATDFDFPHPALAVLTAGHSVSNIDYSVQFVNVQFGKAEGVCTLPLSPGKKILTVCLRPGLTGFATVLESRTPKRPAFKSWPKQEKPI